jgi:protein-disulfide isomerase
LLGALIGLGIAYSLMHFLPYAQEWRVRRFFHVPLPAPQAHSLGDPQAPVCIYYYYSLTCRYCHVFQEKILPQLLQRYVKTGQLRLVFCEFPDDEISLQGFTLLQGLPRSAYFRLLGEILRQQDLFRISPDPLWQIFEQEGLARTQQQTLLANKKLSKALLFRRFDAEDRWNLSAVPSFVLNGQVYEGAFPWEACEKAFQACTRSSP